MPEISSNPTPKLQAFLSHAGVASRRKSEELIAAGKVSVNGQVAQIGQRIDPAKDTIIVNGKKVGAVEPVETYLVYKPVGVVSTTSDELQRETIVEYLQKLLPASTILPRLYPVGRLDLDSEGLMILTNDGELANRFTHPSFEVEKTYQVTVTGHPTQKALDHLERGVRLQEGMTAPAQVNVLESDAETTTLEVTIHEGRYHQVKRMLKRVGYEVTKLVRIRMGEFGVEDLADQKWLRVT